MEFKGRYAYEKKIPQKQKTKQLKQDLRKLRGPVKKNVKQEYSYATWMAKFE